eukprot:Selendium_serpulae@DN9831_c0_g1_i1.p2
MINCDDGSVLLFSVTAPHRRAPPLDPPRRAGTAAAHKPSRLRVDSVQLEVATSPITALAWAAAPWPFLFAAGTASGNIRVWDVRFVHGGRRAVGGGTADSETGGRRQEPHVVSPSGGHVRPITETGPGRA